MNFQSKAELRSLVKKTFKQWTDETYNEKSKNLSTQLTQELNPLKIKTLGAFAPLIPEPMWNLSEGPKVQRLAFPDDRGKGMKFFESDVQSLKITRNFGVEVKTPTGNELIDPEVILVPGLAFDRKGFRLGRGKGIYDRYLCQFSGLKIGICFEEFLFLKVPTEDHDQPMDWIITEANVYKINKG